MSEMLSDEESPKRTPLEETSHADKCPTYSEDVTCYWATEKRRNAHYRLREEEERLRHARSVEAALSLLGIHSCDEKELTARGEHAKKRSRSELSDQTKGKPGKETGRSLFSLDASDPAHWFGIVGGLGSGGYSQVLLAEQLVEYIPTVYASNSSSPTKEGQPNILFTPLRNQHSAALAQSSSDHDEDRVISDHSVAQHRGRLVALKIVPKNRITKPKDKRRIQNEIVALSECAAGCQFIQSCYTGFENDQCVFLACEHVRGGDLYSQLNERRRLHGTRGFSQHELQPLLAELVLAIEHIHLNGYIHRDIKIENVMLTEHGHVRLIDLGLAKKVFDGDMAANNAGSLIYMAPELLHSGSCGVFTDWWAFGILTFEMLSGLCPWERAGDRQKLRKEISTCRRVRLPRGLTHASAHFLTHLLDVSYTNRLGSQGADEVMGAPFFRHMDWQAVRRGDAEPLIIPRERSEVPYTVTISNNEKNHKQDEFPCPSWSFGLPSTTGWPECSPRQRANSESNSEQIEATDTEPNSAISGGTC